MDHRIAGLGRCPDLKLSVVKGPLKHLVEIGRRDRRQRKVARPGGAQVLVRIARHAQFLLRRQVERLKFVIADGPIDAAAIEALQAKVVGQEAQAGAEPMPSGAAHRLEVGAFEAVGPRLPIPVTGCSF